METDFPRCIFVSFPPPTKKFLLALAFGRGLDLKAFKHTWELFMELRGKG
jgi:hypothetical protein